MKLLRILILAFIASAPVFAQQGVVVQFQNQGTPIGTFAGWLPINCSTNLTCSFSGGLITMTSSGGGALPTATAKGQVPSSTGAGNTYVAQNKVLADEQDYSGTTGCDIINNLAAANPYQKVTAEALTGSIYNCANVDLNNPFNTIQLNGGNIFTTDVGWTWGNRQVVNGNVGNIGSTAAVSGTQFRASANFPLGSTPGTLLATGTIGAGTVSLTKTGTAIQLAPYDILVFAGDSTIYYVKKCTAGTDPPCADTTAGGAGASDWYKLTGTITVNITPVLASSPSSAATTLTSAVVEFGDIQGGSPSGEKLESAFLSCALNSGNGIGIRDNYAQENSDGRNAWVNNCGRGFWVPSAANSGDWSNLNVGYTADANCTTPTIPFETSGAHKKFSRVTITTQSCTAAKLTKGIFHITNAQIGGVSAPGGLVLDQVHGEAKGPSNSVDMILVDSANPSPAGNTGAVEIPGASGCPTGNPCLNLLHIASNFAGTLHLHDSTCNNGTTNAVVDDINSNTMTCANNSVALGYYRLDAAGIAHTNLNCTDMTKGWCEYNGVFSYYSGGVAQISFTGATGIGKFAGIATGSATVPATGEVSYPASGAPAGPASGDLTWFDNADLRFHDIGNAGTVGTTVVAKGNVSHQWFSSLSVAGVFTSTQPADSDLSVTDITTNNVSTSAHGFTPKGDNNAAHFLNGQLGWTTPAGGTSSQFAFWSPASGNTSVGTVALNTTKVWGFSLNANITSSTGICYDVNTADNSANVYDIGIYDTTGTLIVHTGAVAGTTLFNNTGIRCNNWTGGGATVVAGRSYLAMTSGTVATATLGATGGLAQFANAVTATGGTTSGGVLNSSITTPADTWATGNVINFTIH